MQGLNNHSLPRVHNSSVQGTFSFSQLLGLFLWADDFGC